MVLEGRNNKLSRRYAMGWWAINDMGDMVNGDAPADYMNEAIAKVIETYEQHQGRKPFEEELQAVFNYCCGPHNLTTFNAEPETTEPENVEPENAEPENAEPENAEPENAEPENVEPDNVEPENAEPVNAEPVNAEPVNAEPVNADANVDLGVIYPALRQIKRFLAVNKQYYLERARDCVADINKSIFDAGPLGIDLDGTIDEAPEFFSMLTKIWPGFVYIVTYRRDYEKACNDIKSHGVHADRVILADKLDKSSIIKEYGIKYYIDDMDECLINMPEDVTVFKIRNGGNFDNGKWLYSNITGRQL
jgi:hypothetical protein